MEKVKLGSLFDGSGGFPLAGELCGITPEWASEIEPYPIAVTQSNFPYMKHLGDINQINGAEIQPVDVITFGSPCQDLSVAGKRAGLKHENNGDEQTTRSGLFMEAVRVIKEMREATNGIYPRFALWENVPGAFSSNKGEDFRTVLEELIKIVEPTATMPPMPKDGWPYADCYLGTGWSVAYRTFDAQYWGVPQRRRRIYLVADFRGECAGEILFKRKGLRGYFETGRTPWQGAAADAERGVTVDDREGDRNCLTPWDVQSRRIFGANGQWPALCGGEGGGHGYVLYPFVYSFDSLASNSMKSKNPHTIDRPAVAYSETYQKVTGPLMANSHPGSYCGQDAYQDMLVIGKECSGAVRVQHIVRRLTPTECARLQGFPDDWGYPEQKNHFTDAEYKFWLNVRNTYAKINGKSKKDYSKEQLLKWYNKLHTDSAEYKTWGNGIALPCALYVMQGIVEAIWKKQRI